MHKCSKQCGEGKHTDTMPASRKQFTFREPTMGEMKEFMGLTPILQAPDAEATAATDDDAAPEEDGEAQWLKSLRMVCTLSVEPKFVEDDASGDEVLLDDNIFRDVVFMIDTMTQASGLDKAAKEANPT